MNMLKKMMLVLLGWVLAYPAAAENFTTAAEVRPILGVTKAQWIAVRRWGGHDYLYFTNLLAWRCGLDKIEYTVNNIVSLELLMEPCHENEAAPNAIKMTKIFPYVEFPTDSVQNVTVTITYDDGEMLSVDYERTAIEIQ